MELRYGDGHVLVLALESSIAPTSLSGVDLVVHLDSTVSAAKLELQTRRAFPLDQVDLFTVLYDQPRDTALLEVLCTAGATRVPVTLSATLDQGKAASLTGKTGSPLSLTLTAVP